jgi:hypothetical protein
MPPLIAPGVSSPSHTHAVCNILRNLGAYTSRMDDISETELQQVCPLLATELVVREPNGSLLQVKDTKWIKDIYTELSPTLNLMLYHILVLT